MTIEITEVEVYPKDEDDSDLLAFGSIVLNEAFVIHNVRLVETDSRIAVAMPNERHRGDYRDIAHPITNQCRKKIEKAFIESYNSHPRVYSNINYNGEPA